MLWDIPSANTKGKDEGTNLILFFLTHGYPIPVVGYGDMKKVFSIQQKETKVQQIG
nr:MAG TPA: Nucleoporin complex subunit 54 [Caudoviricetes sp.]